MEKEKLVLIDGHSILNRAFYGLPDLTNAEGTHTNAVYGFLNIMFKILEEEKPQYLVVAFDVSAPTFRHEIYKEYKGTRKPMPPELKEQVPIMKDVLRAMQVTIVEKAGLEADDILGTLAKRAEKQGMDVALVSGDRDLLQIASEHIMIRIPKTKVGKTEVENYYARDVLEKYQVTPVQFIELKALMGDTADNIPGVPKVGEKTATELMVRFGSIDSIYEHLEEITKKSIRESLQNNRELADLSKTLATINIDADISVEFPDCKISENATSLYTEDAYVMMKKLEFKNFFSRFDLAKSSAGRETHYDIRILPSEEEADTVFHNACNAKQTAIRFYHAPQSEIRNSFGVPFNVKFNMEESGQLSLFEPENDAKANGSLQLALCFEEGRVYYLDSADLGYDFLMKEIHFLYENAKGKLVTFEVKNSYKLLGLSDQGAFDIAERFDDILIAAYLLNPLKSDEQIDDIANEYLGMMVSTYTQVFGKKTMEEAYESQKEEYVDYLCRECFLIAGSYGELLERLKQSDMLDLYEKIEMPLSYVLYEMEKNGIAVNASALKAYGDELSETITALESSIYEQAGRKFNINSPKQLGEILFEDMQMPGGKKTKTGYSTSADVLEKLAPEYPIVNDILEYRTYTKLKSTYADGLAGYITDDGRIHTNFNQTITATGRISSTEPNLQNIPMRMEMGRKIRKVFIPKKGYAFVDADYSQIELRILAAMAGDAELIDAYRTGKDIHTITASKVFHVPMEEVTPLLRRNAKAVNFGIVYGISSFGLSQDLSISKKEAQEYIEEYFATYPGIKEFLEQTKKDAKEKGYSITLFGRRRPIPELKSSNFMQRAFGERVAMNAPIQGTAADIMKIAMINVYERVRREWENRTDKAKVILQIHDELLIEAPADQTEKVITILEEEMKNAANLAVSLEVEAHSGSDWYEAK